MPTVLEHTAVATGPSWLRRMSSNSLQLYEHEVSAFSAVKSDSPIYIEYKPSLLSKPKLTSSMPMYVPPWRTLTRDSVNHKGRPCVVPSVMIESLVTKREYYALVAYATEIFKMRKTYQVC